MNLSYAKELTMDSVVASLLSGELKRKSLETSNLISSSLTLVMDERKGRLQGKSVTRSDKSSGKS